MSSPDAAIATSSGRAVRSFLIADIRGYTAFTSEHGDEAGTRLATTFASIVGEAVEAWSGRLVEVRGDEALCVFEDASAALGAAVELQEAFADESASDQTLPLRVGIGLAMGDAIPVGSGFRGSALNLAARLCSLSEAGEVHASVELVEMAGEPNGLECEQVGGLRLKGFDGSHRAYRLRVQPAPEHVPASVLGDDAGVAPSPSEPDREHPLAGREGEMHWLSWHWRRARHGRGRSVVLRGPAGVGKTRLVSELVAQARQDGAWISYQGPVDPGPPELAPPEVRPGRPGIVIIDGQALGEPTVAASSELARMALLVVIVSNADDGTDESPRLAGSAPPWPRLEVAPLGLAGLREMALLEAPDVVEELPLGRILEESRGLPAPALEAISEWAARVEAERAAAPPHTPTLSEGSSFIGRAQELAVAEELLRESRLLTLVGPPGTGKTRLALRLLREFGDRYADGSWFVPLHAIRDPELLGSAVAGTLGLREGADTAALDVVKSYLAAREALLVLDNFEQLLEAAPVVAGLLASAPQVTILVTSRSSLGVSGEQLFPVPPMEVPPPDREIGADGVQAYDAVALFLTRARGVDPGFTLDASNAEAIAHVTARLEGLPLAIELAAARVRTLAPAELLEQLDRRLPVLTAGGSGHEERHRTMRRAIAWSYELLSGSDQALLRQLAVFRGGFTLGSATTVGRLTRLEAIDGVDSLVAHSLLTRTPTGGRTRFSMLELVREFAVDELDEHDGLADTKARHAQAFLDLALESAPALEGDHATEALARLTPEIDNIRAALEHALNTQDAALGLRLSATIWRLWQSTGQLTEGREWVERCLGLGAGSATDRANAHGAIAGLAYWQGDFDVSRQHYEQARDLFHSVGDRVEEANATYCLSLVATFDEQFDVAERHADEALLVFREFDLEGKVGEVLMAKFTVAWRKGELSRARTLAEEAVATSLSVGNQAMAASQLVGVAGIAFQQGDRATAVARAAQSLEMSIETDNTHTQLFALDALASFTVAESPAAAVRLASAASRLREEHGGGWTLEAFGTEPARNAASNRLAAEEIEAAWDSGQALELEDTIDLARSIMSQSPKATP